MISIAASGESHYCYLYKSVDSDSYGCGKANEVSVSPSSQLMSCNVFPLLRHAAMIKLGPFFEALWPNIPDVSTFSVRYHGYCMRYDSNGPKKWIVLNVVVLRIRRTFADDVALLVGRSPIISGYRNPSLYQLAPFQDPATAYRG
jgi:hypothetical protein